MKLKQYNFDCHLTLGGNYRVTLHAPLDEGCWGIICLAESKDQYVAIRHGKEVLKKLMKILDEELVACNKEEDDE